MDFVATTDARAVEDADKGHDDAIVAYLHVVFDIYEGEYLTVVADFCLGADFSFWTYFACHNFSLFVFHFSLICRLLQEQYTMILPTASY